MLAMKRSFGRFRRVRWFQHAGARHTVPRTAQSTLFIQSLLTTHCSLLLVYMCLGRSFSRRSAGPLQRRPRRLLPKYKHQIIKGDDCIAPVAVGCLSLPGETRFAQQSISSSFAMCGLLLLHRGCVVHWDSTELAYCTVLHCNRSSLSLSTSLTSRLLVGPRGSCALDIVKSGHRDSPTLAGPKRDDPRRAAGGQRKKKSIPRMHADVPQAQ
ncbi:hypothetical protein EXIGLDRAFT_239096 [Exidia glandulosa HHB12029]|uniref:Uncharacterized protein n=1 Tax=Exidia glandulosa HHB12029 TaxID=1314781 RepID=A0A165DZ14_EXIGL|nr:hypothetical protein EXIGLDRAFT_239096 [Exidia glandulosa HHB12029]